MCQYKTVSSTIYTDAQSICKAVTVHWQHTDVRRSVWLAGQKQLKCGGDLSTKFVMLTLVPFLPFYSKGQHLSLTLTHHLDAVMQWADIVEIKSWGEIVQVWWRCTFCLIKKSAVVAVSSTFPHAKDFPAVNSCSNSCSSACSLTCCQWSVHRGGTAGPLQCNIRSAFRLLHGVHGCMWVHWLCKK